LAKNTSFEMKELRETPCPLTATIAVNIAARNKAAQNTLICKRRENVVLSVKLWLKA